MMEIQQHTMVLLGKMLGNESSVPCKKLRQTFLRKSFIVALTLRRKEIKLFSASYLAVQLYSSRELVGQTQFPRINKE